MSSLGAEPRREAFPLAAVLGLIALFVAVAAPALGSHDLWAPDEPRYARISQELLDSGRVALLTLNGEPYSHKPPLQFWLTALAARLLGAGKVTPPLARLVPLCSAALWLLAAALLADRLVGDRLVTVLTAAVLGSATLFLVHSGTAHIEALLGLLTAAAMLAWLADGRRTGPGFWVAVGLGILAKGPVMLLLTLAGVLPDAWRRGKLRDLVSPRSLLGAALGLGLVLAWLVPALRQGTQAFGQNIVLEQTFERIAYGMSHAHPVWYYLTRFPLEFLPWSLILLAPFARALARRPGKPDGERLAADWLALGLGTFSLITEKRGLYLLPLYPAAALLVAAELARVARAAGAGAAPPRSFQVAAGLTALVELGAALAAPGFVPPEIASSREAIRLALVPLGLAAAAALAGLGLRAWRAVPALLGLGLAASFLLVNLEVFPGLDDHKSARPVCDLARLGREGIPIACYKFFDGAYSYYLERNLPVLPDDAALLRYMGEHPRVSLVCVQDDEPALQAAAARAGLALRELGCRRVGHRMVCLVDLGSAAPGG